MQGEQKKGGIVPPLSRSVRTLKRNGELSACALIVNFEADRTGNSRTCYRWCAVYGKLNIDTA